MIRPKARRTNLLNSAFLFCVDGSHLPLLWISFCIMVWKSISSLQVILAVSFLLSLSLAVDGETSSISSSRKGSSARTSKDTFLYFAYGSNLLGRRIHIRNPSARRTAVGELEDYQLDFYLFSKMWNGSIATIVPKPGATTWGSVWKMDIADKDSLDKQESLYFPMEVKIKTTRGNVLTCRTYQLKDNPAPVKNISRLPRKRRPSKTYRQVIIDGAVESDLPASYVDFLKQIPHNGQTSSVMANLNRKKKRKSSKRVL